MDCKGGGTVQQFIDANDASIVFASRFGVIADGVTDDTVALNNAISALVAISGSFTPASSYTLVLPAGRIITQGGHILPSTIKARIVGQGAYTTILYLKNNSNNFILDLQGQFQSVEHLQLDGNRANNATGLDGLRISGAYCLVDRVYVSNCKQDGIVVGHGASAINTRLRNTDVRFCQGYGVNLSGSYSTTDCQFLDVNVGSSGKSGFNLAVSAAKMVNCHSWGNGLENATDNHGYRITSGGHMLEGCQSETNLGRGIYIGSGIRGIVINGGTIWGNTSSGIYAFGAQRCVFTGISIRNNGVQNSAGSGSLDFSNIYFDNSNNMTVSGCNLYDDGLAVSAGTYTVAPTYPYMGRSTVFTVSRHYSENAGSNNNTIAGNTMMAAHTRSGVAITNVGVRNLYSGNNTNETILPALASAATLTVHPHQTVVSITGTTSITSITAMHPKTIITLIFTGIVTVSAGSNLLIGSNYTSSVGSTLSLVCDGTNWYLV